MRNKGKQGRTHYRCVEYIFSVTKLSQPQILLLDTKSNLDVYLMPWADYPLIKSHMDSAGHRYVRLANDERGILLLNDEDVRYHWISLIEKSGMQN